MSYYQNEEDIKILALPQFTLGCLFHFIAIVQGKDDIREF